MGAGRQKGSFSGIGRYCKMKAEQRLITTLDPFIGSHIAIDQRIDPLRVSG